MLKNLKEGSGRLVSRLIPGEGQTMAERLGHLLETDPEFRAEFDRYIKAQLREQYNEALRELHGVMQNPDREREVVWELLSMVRTSGWPAPEHVPALTELERIARETGGTAYVAVEKMVFEELSKLVREQGESITRVQELFPFLGETFRYQRKYDNFAARRREASLGIAAKIACLTRDERALALLHEALAHSTPKIRGVAAIVIYDTYQWMGCDMPEMLLARFWQMADEDRSKRVRQTALAVLQRLGLISYEEAMNRLEGKG